MATGIGFHRFGFLPLLGILIGLGGAGSAQSAESVERNLLHKNAVFVVEIRHPMQWAKHPIFEQAWESLSKSQQVRAGLETPEYGRVLAARDFLENASGQNWQETLEELTDGGIWAAITPKPNERLTFVLSAKNGKILNRLQDAAFAVLKNQSQAEPASQTYRGVKTYRLDKSFLAIVGSRLLVASHKSDIQHMIDGLVDSANQTTVRPSNDEETQPSIQLEVNLGAVRKAPDLQKALKRPADDAGAVTLVGGWLDLLRQGDRLRGEMSWPKDSSEIQLKLTDDSVEPHEGLEGFFAANAKHELAPLLKPPGAIYSASWFRDYRALWNQRDDLLTPAALAKLEKGDRDVKQQFSVFGVSFSPSELFQQLGTQFRVVLARASETEYRVSLKNRLPAGALCVSLRDESAFLTQAEPLSRALGLVAAFGEAKMLTKKSEHRGANLTGFWFRDDEKSTARGNQLRYNFNPTWAVARKHFVLGSTRKIVTQVIDELDRQTGELSSSLEPSSRSAIVTDRQLLEFSELGEGLLDFREAIVQGSIFDRGLRLTEGDHELKLAKQLLQSLGQLTTQAAFENQNFEYRIRILPKNSTDR